MLVDAHSHLDRYDLVGESALGSALKEIARYQIFTISNSMDLPSYEHNLAIGATSGWVLPIFGVHPWKAPEYAHRLKELREAIGQSPMLGEIGLDFHFIKDTSEYPAQRRVFEFFLEAARDYGKIVNVHTKGAEEAVLELLDRYDIGPAIVHWYSGPLDIFDELATRGVYFTVGVEVLYSEWIRTITRRIPSKQLLSETDNPGGPKGYLGRPGMPALVKKVVQGIAEARGTCAEAIIQTVRANLLRLFREDPRLRDTKLLEAWENGA
jgi:TatD DNase family protein